MLWRSRPKHVHWRVNLDMSARQITQRLPSAFQNLPVCHQIIWITLLMRQTIGLFFRTIRKVPNWLMMLLVVVFLGGITLWINDVDIKFPKDLISQEAIKAIFQSAESISITSAVILYFKEAPDRKARKHYEATQVLDIAAAGKVPTSYARFIALEDLNEDGFPLKGLDVPEADLAGIQLPNANLLGAELQLTNLEGANLAKANLSRANLQDANLLGAILRKAILRKATLDRVDLRGANLEKANLAGATLQGANLEDTNLRAANLYQSNLEKANLWGANLNDANLEEANLLNANLEKADLRGASLKKLQWQNARLCRTTLPDGTISNRDCLV